MLHTDTTHTHVHYIHYIYVTFFYKILQILLLVFAPNVRPGLIFGEGLFTWTTVYIY